MEDDSSDKDVEENLQRKSFGKIFNDGNVLQSIWVRYHSVSTVLTDRKFVVGKFNFILRFGSLLWVIFLLKRTL